MKRRRFFQAIAAAPAASALLAQQPTNAPIQPPAGASVELPKIEINVPDAAADPMPHFFSATQFAALRKLCDILMPAMNGVPGALDARAPEFLDFLLGESAPDRQQVYTKGLDALNTQATKQFGKAFSETDASQAEVLLAPLRAPWTHDLPADPVARLLRVAKQDVRTATTNSREYSAAVPAGGRRFGGAGLYWYPLD